MTNKIEKHLPAGLLAAALTALVLATACTSAAGAPDQQPMPDGVTMVGRVDVAAILADDALANLFDALPEKDDGPSSLADALAMVETETGIDSAQVSEILFFATGSEAEDIGLILGGTLALDKLLAAVEASQGTTANVGKVLGKAVHTFASNDGDNFSIATLSNGRLVAGGPDAVRSAIEVDAGQRAAASGDLIDRLAALGTPWLSLVADVSPDDVGKALGDDGPVGALGGEIAIDFSALEDVRSVSVTLDRRGGLFEAEADIGFATEDGTARASDMINGLTSLFKAFAPDPELVSFLDGLEVEAADATVSIDFTIATDEAVKLAWNLFTVFP